MIGFSRRGSEHAAESNLDVAKLFFDSFSHRLSEIENGLAALSSEIPQLKESRDQSQVSDIVLLERLEKLEEMLLESFMWIRKVAEATYLHAKNPLQGLQIPTSPTEREPGLLEPSNVVVGPSGQAGSLGSITTPTELQVLSLLADKGPLSAPEVGRLVGRSREHSARLMKSLFEEGFVRRDQSRVPFRYSLADRVRQGFKKGEARPEGEQTVAASPA